MIWDNKDPRVKRIESGDYNLSELLEMVGDENIFVNNGSVRAIEKLDLAQDKWLELINFRDARIRAFAVRKIQDRNILITLAKTSEIEDVRLVALHTLYYKQDVNQEVQEVLVCAAKNDESVRIRYLAVENIIDEKVLQELFESEKADLVRTTICSRIGHEYGESNLCIKCGWLICYEIGHKCDENNICTICGKNIPCEHEYD